MRKRVYIACPIAKPATDDGLHHNVRQANEAMLALMKAGYSPFNPALSAFAGGVEQTHTTGYAVRATAHRYLNNEFTRITHGDWLSVDKAWVAVADAVLRLPGESVGADEEVAFATARGIPVFTNLPALRQHFEAGVGVETKWDRRFLSLAAFVAEWSKDPSTKTGAVIVAPDRSVVGLGFNGFARGVGDQPERYADRELKYSLIAHCETNAILTARRDLTGCTLYTTPFMSCSRCAGMVIQAGIKRCVAPPIPADKRDRWAKDMALAEMQFREAGVQLDLIG